MGSKKRRLIVALVVTVALVVVVVSAALFTDFDSPRLGRLALDRIGQSSGFDLRAEGFRLNLLRGLELQKVEASGPLADGELSASMDRLVLKHRPGDLLGGRLTVTEMMLERPRLELASTAGPDSVVSEAGTTSETAATGPEEPAAESEGTSLALAISTIRLEEGSLAQRTTSDDGTETMRVQGLDVTLNGLSFGSSPTADAAANGRIRIDEIVLATVTAGGVTEETNVRGVDVDIETLTFDPGDASNLAGIMLRGTGRMAEVAASDGTTRETLATNAETSIEMAEGRLQLPDLRLKAPQGDLSGTLEADVAADPLTYSLELGGDALSTGVLLGIGDFAGLGTTSFQLTASGTGSDTRQMIGQGRLTINGGSLPDHPVLAQVEQLLGNAVLVGAGYEAFPLEFDIRTNRVHLTPCELRAGPISLTLSGWVDLEGPLEMKLSVLTPREGLRIEEIPAEVLDALSEDDGRVNLPLLVAGTAEASKVALDKDLLKQLGRRYAKKTVEKELTKALVGLFGNKEKNDG